MPLRSALASTAAALALTAPAATAAPVRLSPENARVQAITVTGGRALAVVDSLDPVEPFELVTTRGSGTSVVGTFGLREAEFPDIAVDNLGRVVAAWSRVISGGAALEVLGVDLSANEPFGAAQVLGQSTGPPRLAVTGGAPLLAFPDRDGNLALISNPLATGEDRAAARPMPYAITSSGPARRHLPFDLVIGPSGPLVLDLAQTRALTELRVVGPGVPTAPVTSGKGVRDLPSALAADDSHIAVAYLSGGRVIVATPRSDGTWARRRLPGPGGATDPPAVMFVGGDVTVAYDQRVPRFGKRPLQQLFLATLAGGRVTWRRLTNSHADDGRPLAAADPAGEAFVAWTRVSLGTKRRTPYATRVD